MNDCPNNPKHMIFIDDSACLIYLDDGCEGAAADDDGDYGSFTGRADSELLNQSIEAAMPKRCV